MGNITNERDTLSRAFQLLHFLLVATVVVYKGGLAGVFIAGANAGKVQAAGDTADMKVVGMFNDSVDNSDDGKGVNIKPGCFFLDNSETNALTAAHLFKPCYVEDDQTVSSDPGVNAVQAGIVIAIDPDGVWILVNPAALAGVALPAIPQAAAVADPAACDALTASAPAALTAAAPAASTYAAPAALTSPAAGTGTGADATTFNGAECDALRADVAAIRTALIAAGVDLAAFRIPIAANVVDVAAMRIPIAANVVDAAAEKTAIDANKAGIVAVIDELQTVDLMA